MTARFCDLPNGPAAPHMPPSNTARIVRGLPFDEYRGLDGLHFSTLKEIETSPLHFQHATANERDETDAMRLGYAVHALTLDPRPPKVAVYEGAVRRGKAWEAFLGEHHGELILRRSEVETASAMREAIFAHPPARALLADGDGEVTVLWSMLGHACRGRLDWLRSSGGLVELKTTRSIRSRAFMAAFALRFYHAQIAFYLGGLSAAFGLEPRELPAVIAVENEPPYDVAVYRIGYDTIEAGQRKIDEWVRRVDACRRSGRWPGVSGDEELDLRLPDWALSSGLPDVDLDTIGGDHG